MQQVGLARATFCLATRCLNAGDAEYAWTISDRCRRAGLLVTSEDEALTMFPALNIDQKVAREVLDILKHCL